MPLLRWDDPVRLVIWKQEVALQRDAAISANTLFACLYSLSNVRITYLGMRQLCTLSQEKQSGCFGSLAIRSRAQRIDYWCGNVTRNPMVDYSIPTHRPA